jgi:hypothetical protein
MENDDYKAAVSRWPLTDDAIECGAKALAEALAGGKWETHFTDGQKQLWRDRVKKAMD